MLKILKKNLLRLNSFLLAYANCIAFSVSHTFFILSANSLGILNSFS